MSEFPYLPFSTDAYLADTRHLSAEEHGAYLLLLMMAWRTPECRLPDDDVKLARWASVSPKVWRRLRPTVMGFWTLADGFWSQKRLNREREFVSRRAQVSRSNGERGGRPKSLENNETANPAGGLQETRSESTSTSTSKNTPISPLGTKRAVRKIGAGYGDATDPLYADFAANVWAKRWDRPDNKPKPAFLAFAKLEEAGRTSCKMAIEAVARAMLSRSEPAYRPMLSTWINNRGWEAAASVPSSAQSVNWSKNVAYFRDTGEWPIGWGPRPGSPGCKCPPELLLGVAAA